MRLLSGELLILASLNTLNLDILEAYRDRWGIERTFLCLKTKGFNFERTNLKNSEKLSKLLVICVFALVISIQMVIVVEEQTPIKIKKHRRSLYSLFTYGFDCCRQFLLNQNVAYQIKAFFEEALKRFSRPRPIMRKMLEIRESPCARIAP